MYLPFVYAIHSLNDSYLMQSCALCCDHSWDEFCTLYTGSVYICSCKKLSVHMQHAAYAWHYLYCKLDCKFLWQMIYLWEGIKALKCDSADSRSSQQLGKIEVCSRSHAACACLRGICFIFRGGKKDKKGHVAYHLVLNHL